MSEKEYKFFSHPNCKYFPCHKGLGEEEFNCLFCYCPLYFMGERCGGNFRILESGIKDCTNCLFPHRKDNYDRMIEKMRGFIREDAQKRKAGKSDAEGSIS